MQPKICKGLAFGQQVFGLLKRYLPNAKPLRKATRTSQAIICRTLNPYARRSGLLSHLLNKCIKNKGTECQFILCPGLLHSVERWVSSGWEQMKQMLFSPFVRSGIIPTSRKIVIQWGHFYSNLTILFIADKTFRLTIKGRLQSSFERMPSECRTLNTYWKLRNALHDVQFSQL